MKHCNGCNKDFENPAAHFNKSLTKSTGYNSRCKSCTRIKDRLYEKTYEVKARRKRTRDQLSHKIEARSKARAKYGSSSKYKCAVLICESMAQAFHHTSYTDVYSVIPLCTKHHVDNHSLCEMEFETRNS